jgi:hypothetical protein
MVGLTLILLAFSPDLSRLGADAYHVREWETRRCDNPLSVLLLPDATSCPEVNARIAYLRKRWRPLTPLQVELRTFDADPGRWATQYLALGRSAVARRFDFYESMILNRPENYGPMFEKLPVPRDRYWNFWQGWLMPRDFPAWLDYLDYHQNVAPRPREVTP